MKITNLASFPYLVLRDSEYIVTELLDSIDKFKTTTSRFIKSDSLHNNKTDTNIIFSHVLRGTNMKNLSKGIFLISTAKPMGDGYFQVTPMLLIDNSKVDTNILDKVTVKYANGDTTDFNNYDEAHKSLTSELQKYSIIYSYNDNGEFTCEISKKLLAKIDRCYYALSVIDGNQRNKIIYDSNLVLDTKGKVIKSRHFQQGAYVKLNIDNIPINTLIPYSTNVNSEVGLCLVANKEGYKVEKDDANMFNEKMIYDAVIYNEKISKPKSPYISDL